MTLPCRQFCNAGRLCAPGKCGNPYSRDDPRYWLGRGNEPVAGKPFGWAHAMERDAIRRHLRRRIWKFGLDGMAAVRLEFRVTQIQQRLQRDYHRRKPPIGVKHVVQAPPTFNRDQLQHIADMWADANDPMSRDCAVVALGLLARSVT